MSQSGRSSGESPAPGWTAARAVAVVGLTLVLCAMALAFARMVVVAGDSVSACDRGKLLWAILACAAACALVLSLVLAAARRLPLPLASPLLLVPAGLFAPALYLFALLLSFGACYTGR